MKAKRIISLLLSLAIVCLTFAGCSGGGGESSQPENSSGTESASADNGEMKYPELNYTSKTVKVCVEHNPTSSWIVDWQTTFEKYNPGVTVEYCQATPDELPSKLAVWYSTEQSPDIVYCKPETSWPVLYNKGLVEPIDDYVNFNEAFWKDTKTSADLYMAEDKHYSIICHAEPRGYVIYNKQTFKNAGLEEPLSLFYKNQWTMEKFEEYGKTLTKENTSDSSKSRYGFYFHGLMQFVGITGKDFIEYKDNQWKSNLMDPDIVNVMDFLKRVGPTDQKYCWDDDVDPTLARSQTITGQIAMFCTSETPESEFPEECKNGTLSVVPLPMYNEEVGYVMPALVDGFVIPKGAKNPEAGVAYAAAVRANIHLDKEHMNETNTSVELKKLYDYIYTSGKVTCIPATFRIIESEYPYDALMGRVWRYGETWSKVVAEMEPLVLNALKSKE